MVPDSEGSSFPFLGSGLPYIIAMPPKGELVGFGVYQQIEQFWR